MRELPATHRVLAEPGVAAYEATLGRTTIKRAIELVLDRARASGAAPEYGAIVASVVESLDEARMDLLLPAINATGIVVHTNLGRAPLAEEAIDAIAAVSRGYSNLEYDLAAGTRGSRYDRVTALVCEATGAQAALVVNNCAAAVLLALDTLAKGREVVVARSELVEIGGGFRVPDVLAQAGATAIEVGTTNRVYVEDFERALSPRTALFLRTHPSNYRIEGFVHAPDPHELAASAKRAGVPVLEDLGSGALCDLGEYGLPRERTAAEAIAQGAALVTFSGDKLLGGPQAGIVAGSATLIARLRGNPLLRALRVDKTTLAALAATLRLHRTPQSRLRIPIYRMLAATAGELRARAAAYAERLPQLAIVESEAFVGGGALPQSRVASVAVALRAAHPDAAASALRRGDPPVVPRVEADRVLFDLRTVAPEQDAALIAAIERAIGKPPS